MKTLFQKFATDLISAGIAAASVAVLALNLDATNYKTVAFVAAIAFVNGLINAARRALPVPAA